MRGLACLSTITLAICLSGCATPFGQKAHYDFGVANAPGTITLSDPKLYSREMLIDERNKEVIWLDSLITESQDRTKITFQPEIVREVEQVTAMSAALGLKFDPASAVTYRRSQATDDLQQEIDVMKLQLQLDQLKHDAELVRQKIATQTEPANTGLGLSSGAASSSAAPEGTVTSVDQLMTAITKLNTDVAKLLTTNYAGPTATTITASPLDDFRDRTAYRNVLKAARNAASLDELHDAGNGRLIRLNFQATAVPTESYQRSLGAIQVKVVPPSDPTLSDKFLYDWLRAVNLDPAYHNSDGSVKADSDLQALVDTGDFEVISIRTAPTSVSIVLPALIESSGARLSPVALYRRSQWEADDNVDTRNFGSAASRLSNADKATIDGKLCTLGSPEALLAERSMYLANDRKQSYDFVRIVNAVAEARGLGQPYPKAKEQQDRYAGLKSNIAARVGDCAVMYQNLTDNAPRYSWQILQDDAFGPGSDQIRIYDVGPEEQVQEISTNARAANSLALAASIAASAPQSGVAGNAAMGYTREAAGRASVLERVPSVVGYSVGGNNTFGWVIGPRAALDPAGKLEMAQYLKPYDVSVDLSVPGWWPGMSLDVVSSWAPSPEALARGALPQAATQHIPVPLTRDRTANLAFTLYLLDHLGRSVEIDNISGPPMSACAPATMLIKGRNIWRTEKILVLGQLLDRKNISIMPDMTGVIVTVPAVQPVPGQTMDSKLYVMTPFGTKESTSYPYIATPSGDGCKPAKPEAVAPDPKAVSIASPVPDEVNVPATFTITLTGKNLSRVHHVTLYGQPGAITAQPADGLSLNVKFDKDDTAAIPTSNTATLVLLDSASKQMATTVVRIHNTGGN